MVTAGHLPAANFRHCTRSPILVNLVGPALGGLAAAADGLWGLGALPLRWPPRPTFGGARPRPHSAPVPTVSHPPAACSAPPTRLRALAGAASLVMALTPVGMALTGWL